MGNFKCEKCGHEQIVTTALRIEPIQNWERNVDSALAQKMSQFINISEDSDTHAVLYLSTSYRETLMANIIHDGYNREQRLEAIFADKFVDVLNVIDKNFNIVGTTNGPSWMPGAIIDLTNPMFLFCFVVVEKGEQFQEKIEELGLECLTQKEAFGSVTTLDQLE